MCDAYSFSLHFRGKGDYYRLGHGDDSHQRSPKRVMGALASEKVVDIACGSLHCIVCTESGKVFTWGDNDEGQVGNDSSTPVQSPHVSKTFSTGSGQTFLIICSRAPSYSNSDITHCL